MTAEYGIIGHNTADATVTTMGGIMLQFWALVYKLRAQQSRAGAIMFHVLNLLLPLGILVAVHYLKRSMCPIYFSIIDAHALVAVAGMR